MGKRLWAEGNLRVVFLLIPTLSSALFHYLRVVPVIKSLLAEKIQILGYWNKLGNSQCLP